MPMKKLLPVVLWIPTASLAVILMVIAYAVNPAARRPLPTVAGESIVAANIANASFSEGDPVPILPPLASDFIALDARPKIIASFLERYSCPLTPYDKYAEVYVEAADKYKLDFRLVPAISMQESNCCKKIPGGSNNCWGYGIYGDQIVVFPSVEAGIDTVARTLSKKYTSQGLLEPDEIMKKYTPQSKGSWAAGVLHFMNEMK
jgi:hypothetical protein